MITSDQVSVVLDRLCEHYHQNNCPIPIVPALVTRADVIKWALEIPDLSEQLTRMLNTVMAPTKDIP